MKKTEFFRNLAFFSDEDYNRFLLFLMSPVFKKHGGLDAIFKAIKNRKHLLSSGNPDELKKIIIQVTGITEGTLRKSLSHLNESIIDYFRFKALYSDELNAEIVLNDYLIKMNNLDSAKDVNANAERLLKEQYGSNEMYFYSAAGHCINDLNLLVCENNFSETGVMEKQGTLAKETAVNLYLFTLQKLVFLFINLVSVRTDTGNTQTGEKLLNLDIFFSENNITSGIAAKDDVHVLFILLQRAYELYSNLINDYKFTIFNDCYFVNLNLIPLNMRKRFLNILINYCVIRQRLHDPNRVYAEKELRLLYQFIENEYYADSSSKYLNSMTYRNFITGCLRVNNHKIMKKFIDNHTKKLIPEDIERMKSFALAHYYFCIKNYSKSLKNINSIHNPGHFYKYDLRNLELKIYYEKRNFINIESILHNYRNCVTEDRILTSYDRNRMLLFLKYFGKYIILLNKPGKSGTNTELGMLLNKIEKEKNFAMQKWMIAEIKQELIKHAYPVKKYGEM
ncbi:MAG: hypothetical protein MUE56_01205 [Ignavibacteria bacterium]|nr:hypothetical protein [Ignavibacteria bacterium]